MKICAQIDPHGQTQRDIRDQHRPPCIVDSRGAHHQKERNQYRLHGQQNTDDKDAVQQFGDLVVQLSKRKSCHIG
ncbi:hypothetical protein SDC9_127736 [bioreactor metagenome]|uniref:Uncharacterized protein n=1 Tax=bioreactor metagenome TaxID=1076179 RepID=A0A645CU98_9ZZZZ